MAAALHTDYGLSIKEAAACAVCSERTVSSIVNAMATRRALTANGHSFSRFRLNDGQLRALSNVRHRIPALREAARIAADAKLTSEQVREITDEMKVAPDDAAVLEIAAKARNLYRDQINKKPRPRSSRRVSELRRSFTTVVKFANEKGGLATFAKECRDVERADILERLTSAKAAIAKIESTINR
jgi:hypothetical protein